MGSWLTGFSVHVACDDGSIKLWIYA